MSRLPSRVFPSQGHPAFQSFPTVEDLEVLDEYLTLNSDREEEISTVTEAHGFFCAICTAPHVIMPRVWLTFFHQGGFKSKDHTVRLTMTLFRFYNQVGRSLENIESFEPLILREGSLISYEEATFEEVGRWCRGYIRGAFLDPLWTEDVESSASLLPFFVLSGDISVKGEHDKEGNLILDDLPYKEQYRNDDLIYLVKEFYRLWEELRQNGILLPMHFQEESAPQPSRNDPCPCGSGKKYKNCCLH